MGFCPSARFQGISLAPCSLVVQSVQPFKFRLANSTKLVFPQLQRLVDICGLACGPTGVFKGLDSLFTTLESLVEVLA